jgi:hypothetical protein
MTMWLTLVLALGIGAIAGCNGKALETRPQPDAGGAPPRRSWRV